MVALQAIFLIHFITFFSELSLIAGRENLAHNTFIRYTFKDGDPLGPENWETLPNGDHTRNFCTKVDAGDDKYMTPGTPLNILTSQATLPIRDIEEEFQLDMKKPSLSFRVRKDIEYIEWDYGYPTDTYYGLEIRAPRLGLLTVIDSYDPVGESIAYDFHFAFLSFCDFSQAAKERSSHQLDGKRFPLEINMVFFSQPREIGMDNNVYPINNETRIIMISILGEVGSEHNKLLDPLMETAKSYEGGDFDLDDTDDKFTIKIKPPFSPTWLLPKESQYYYYLEGTFPVAPCFPITQVYVFKTPIKISDGQLKTLTNLKTEREPNKKFSCTFGLLRTAILPTDVYYNPYPHKIIGSDGRNEKFEENYAEIMHSTKYIQLFSFLLAASLLRWY